MYCSAQRGEIAERGRALESLATSQAEKEAGEELIRRIELQIRTLNDDKAALLARTDTAEDRAKELTRQRDSAAAERSRLAEQLGVAHTARLGPLLTGRIPQTFAELRQGLRRSTQTAILGVSEMRQHPTVRRQGPAQPNDFRGVIGGGCR